ncbi:MAG: hypothetical protein H6581_19470 [Bacteroidia bacterium]|nr:hypothetical protein [Bacteroidia bacterium]
MKKILFFPLILLLVPFFAQSQAINKVVIKKFANGKPEEVHFYRGETAQENLTEKQIFSDNGKMLLKELYFNGELHGLREEWNQFGVKTAEQNYKGGKMNGPAKKWVGMVDNVLLESLNFEDGQPAGKQEYFNETGDLMKELNYKDGKLNGKLLEFYGKDQPKREFNLVNGVPHMAQKEWDKEGNLKFSLNFVLGKLTGEQIWNNAGTGKEVKEDWINGIWEKVTQTWPSGNPKVREYFNYDFVELGTEGEELTFKGNKSKFKTCSFFETGTMQSQQTEGDEASYKEWHPNTQVAAEGKGSPEKPVGTWTWYHKNGKKASEGNHENFKKAGDWISWNEAGQVTAEETYAAGKRTAWKVYFYFGDGTKMANGGLDDVGNKAGEWEYRYENGKISRKETYQPAPGTGQRPVLKSVKAFDREGLPVLEGNEAKVTVTTYEAGVKTKETVVKPMGRSEFRCEYFDEKTGKMARADSKDVIESNHVMQVLDGPGVILEERIFFPEGGLKQVDRYNVKGKREGVQEGWYDPKDKKYEYTYNEEGQLSGAVKEWYPTGEPMMDLTYGSVGGTPEVTKGTYYSDKGKDYPYDRADDDKKKKKMLEIEEISYLNEFLKQL